MESKSKIQNFITFKEIADIICLDNKRLSKHLWFSICMFCLSSQVPLPIWVDKSISSYVMALVISHQVHPNAKMCGLIYII